MSGGDSDAASWRAVGISAPDRGRVTGLRRCVRWGLPLVWVISAVLAGCASASALTDRGHVFGSTLQGSGEQAFKEPTGVAVDESTGDVYVVDRGHERVERFKPKGAGGYVFVSSVRVDSPGAVVVDNATKSPSKGDVYVAGTKEFGAEATERDYIYKFTGTGEKLFKRSMFKAKEEDGAAELELEDIKGLAVDGKGTLWVYWEEEGKIDGFSNAESNKWIPSLTPPEFEGAESKIEECTARPDFAVAPSDESFYAGYERENSGEECPGEEEEAPDPSVVANLAGSGATLLSKEVDRENTTGVAVEASTRNVYLDNGSSVAAFTSSGLLMERFGTGQLSAASGIAVDGKNGDVFVAEPGEDQVAVFVPEGPGPPVVDGVSAQNLTPSATELRAQIDPDGAGTEYYFQYGTVDCAVSPSSCTDVPVPAGEIKAGFGDQSVSEEVGGLQPATAYYYRLLASNSLSLSGPVEGAPSPNTFTTLPAPSVLPDGRGWEMVSPPNKHGAAIEALPREGGAMIMASTDGSAITWVASGPLVSEPEGSRSPELTQLLSSRGSEEWETQSLETPHERGSGVEKVEPIGVEYQYFSADLSLGLLQPAVPAVEGTPRIGLVEQPPLSPAASEKTIYVRDDPPIEPDEAEKPAYEQAGSERNREYLAPGYLPLVTAANDTAKTEFGGALDFLGATPDLSHVVFESNGVGLTSSAPLTGGLYEWAAGAPLQLVSVLPDGAPASEPFLGDGQDQSGFPGLNARNAISSDGTRIFWTAGKEHLYMRDIESGETIQVNAAQGHEATEPGHGKQEVAEPGEHRQEVHFQAASSDGSKVFFTDTARLTEDSTLEPLGEEGPADLYELELTGGRGEPLRGSLTDLTPVSAEGSADVLNLIPGAGEDGSYVYFVANGVLAPGASPGHCARYYGEVEESPPPPGATCNLYVSEPVPEHPGRRETKYIAALSYEDGADWGAGPDLSPRTRTRSQCRDLATVAGRPLSGVHVGAEPDGVRQRRRHQRTPR